MPAVARCRRQPRGRGRAGATPPRRGALPGEEPAGSPRAPLAKFSSEQPNPAPRARWWAGRAGRPRSAPARSRRTGETFPPRPQRRRWAPTRCRSAPAAGLPPPPPCSSGPSACSAGGKGTGEGAEGPAAAAVPPAGCGGAGRAEGLCAAIPDLRTRVQGAPCWRRPARWAGGGELVAAVFGFKFKPKQAKDVCWFWRGTKQCLKRACLFLNNAPLRAVPLSFHAVSVPQVFAWVGSA